MAPSQRGLGVMMKRGRKGVTARPNGAGVHINIENVISCERRQPASEVPMRKAGGLAEAPPRSPWLKALALDRRDCKQLMHLLAENPCRVVQKDKEGFTVVHAAAMRGCLELLDQVFDLFKDNDRFVDAEEGIEVSLEELLKAETSLENVGEARLTAFELAWWSMGDSGCRDYLLEGQRESGTFLSHQSEIFGSSIDSEVDEEESDDDDIDDEESSSPRALLLGVLADHRSLLSNERMRPEFEEDVEYNFVADCEELRFHHACQYVGELYTEYTYKMYVEAVIEGCVEKGPAVLKYLFRLRNAQGRTPLHVAVESSYSSYLARLIPGGESGQENAQCLNMRNSRGWTALHCASAQGNINNLNVLLADRRVDVNAKVKYMTQRRYWDRSEATPLHLAVINNKSKVVERLLQDPRTDVNALFYRRIYFDDSLYVSRFRDYLPRWTALQMAAVVGLPEVVKVLITHPEVCICSHVNPSVTKDTFN